MGPQAQWLLFIIPLKAAILKEYQMRGDNNRLNKTPFSHTYKRIIQLIAIVKFHLIIKETVMPLTKQKLQRLPHGGA
jgi:hypothetical protein